MPFLFIFLSLSIFIYLFTLLSWLHHILPLIFQHPLFISTPPSYINPHFINNLTSLTPPFYINPLLISTTTFSTPPPYANLRILDNSSGRYAVPLPSPSTNSAPSSAPIWPRLTLCPSSTVSCATLTMCASEFWSISPTFSRLSMV